MKLIILAAGSGKRLMPYTNGVPKCMVKINGIPLIRYQLQVIKDSGLTDIIIVKGHYHQKLTVPGAKSYLNKKYNQTNMLFSLFCAEPELEGDVIISYSDIVYSKNILNKLIESEKDISVVIDQDWKNYWLKRFNNPLDDAESLKIDQTGKIVEIGKPASQYNQINGQYIGLTKFSSKGVKKLKSLYNKSKLNNIILNTSLDQAFMTDMLQALIVQGESLWPVYTKGGWIEVDTVNDLNLPLTKERLKKISDL